MKRPDCGNRKTDDARHHQVAELPVVRFIPLAQDIAGPAGQESGQNAPNIYVVLLNQGKVTMPLP